MPLRPATHHQLTARQFGAHTQLRHPGDAQTFKRHAFQAVSHRRFVHRGEAQIALTQQQVHRASEKGPGAVGKQRHTALTFHIE